LAAAWRACALHAARTFCLRLPKLGVSDGMGNDNQVDIVYSLTGGDDNVWISYDAFDVTDD